jgi:PPK2 family polyphosphate:nucleotide phosphotransferase
MNTDRLIDSCRVTHGRKFQLSAFDPASTGGVDSRKKAEQRLEEGVARLAALQERLYARREWSLLLIFQAMDAAGKDSAIKHVMSGVNPQGCDVHSFKAPSTEELDHDFLWRCVRHLPERGRIGIFNRSYYEETLIVRVHPEMLQKQRLPEGLVTRHLWKERFEDIRALERHLARSGTVVLKFFLHVSRAEQRQRFLARLEEKDKNWKFSADDLAERRRWKTYMDAYEETIRHTATKLAPWYVVPADHKWFTRLVIAETIIAALEKLDLRTPELSKTEKAKLAAAHKALLKERL